MKIRSNSVVSVIEKTEYLLVEEFAKLARLHPETVRKWLRLGILRGRKVSRGWRIPSVELERVFEGGAL